MQLTPINTKFMDISRKAELKMIPQQERVSRCKNARMSLSLLRHWCRSPFMIKLVHGNPRGLLLLLAAAWVAALREGEAS